MSELLSTSTQARCLSRLSDDFWCCVASTPWRYDLFQLLRRLDAQGGERYPLGRAPLPRFELLRIGQKPSMAFAHSTLAEVNQRERPLFHKVSILNFGLFGPNGSLPLHITEYVRGRIDHHNDSSFSAFVDLFHHRLTLLFFRAWADAQPTISLDRDDNKRFEHYLACLIGMGQAAELESVSLSHHSRFTHAGHLTRHGRDPEGLEKILRDYFQVPVRLVTNIAQWIALSEREQTRLGVGANRAKIGVSAFLGIAVLDVQHKFRIEIGPLDTDAYQRFLPDGLWYTQLRDWVRQYLGIEYQWEVRLILLAEAVSGCSLSGNGRLGYSLWLGYQRSPEARGDVLLTPER